jgi:hypothetical protein
MEKDFLAPVVRDNETEAFVLHDFLDRAVHLICSRVNPRSSAIELRLRELYVNSRMRAGSGFSHRTLHLMLKALTLKEIERIFTVTDALGISREALVIPLRTESPGRLKIGKDGKLEIVVDRDSEFEDWLTRLEPAIRSLMNLPPD